MVQSTPRDQETLKRDETYNLIAADKVQGTTVYNQAGDDLGKLDDVMIDKVSGKVAYAVVTFGGFLGMGAERRALPWSVLRYDTNLDGYVSTATDDTLRNSPDIADYADPQSGRRLYDYYGVSPFWQ
jgi:PRC-barrel domain protein